MGCSTNSLNQLNPLLPNLPLRRRQAKMVRDNATRHKRDYAAQVSVILNLKGHKNRVFVCFFRSRGFCLIGWFAYWWSCIGKGLWSTGYPVLFWICLYQRQIKKSNFEEETNCLFNCYHPYKRCQVMSNIIFFFF